MIAPRPWVDGVDYHDGYPNPERFEQDRQRLISAIAENGAALPDLAKTEGWARDRLDTIGDAVAYDWEEYKTVAASAGIGVRGLDHDYEPAAGEPLRPGEVRDPTRPVQALKRVYFKVPAMTSWTYHDVQAETCHRRASVLDRFAEGGRPPVHPLGRAEKVEAETAYMRAELSQQIPDRRRSNVAGHLPPPPRRPPPPTVVAVR